MDEWFIIPDLEQFTDKARAIVYNNFGLWDEKSDIDVLIDDVAENEKEDFDKILSHQESLIIVKQIVRRQTNKKNNKIRYILNDKLFADIVHSLNARMISNIINGLVKKGLVETAFDSDYNDFVFWVKNNEQDKDKTDKPETD